jgi:hypothetical protein
MNVLPPLDCEEERSSENNDNVNSDDHDFSTPREESTKREARHNHNAELIVKIVSASFGPCEGRRLLTGELSSDETSSIPHTRDVAPFLRALLIAQQYREARADQSNNNSRSDGNADADPSPDTRIVRMNAITSQGMKRATIALGGMQSMNAVFGDPCPGTSKRLHVLIILREGDKRNGRPCFAGSFVRSCFMSFAEHEHVVFQRR